MRKTIDKFYAFHYRFRNKDYFYVTLRKYVTLKSSQDFLLKVLKHALNPEDTIKLNLEINRIIFESKFPERERYFINPVKVEVKYSEKWDRYEYDFEVVNYDSMTIGLVENDVIVFTGE